MYRTDAPYHNNRPRHREYRERRPMNPDRKPDNFVAKWRSAMTLAISNVFDRDQIELRSFSYPKYEVDNGVKADKMWCRQWYFHTLSDFGSFIDALNEAADKIEAEKLLANPMPEIKPGEEVPFMDHGEDRKLEFKIVKKWRSIMSVVIADNRGFDQIEIRIPNNVTGKWKRVFYFRSEDDFTEFINTLNDGYDKMEDERLIPPGVEQQEPYQPN